MVFFYLPILFVGIDIWFNGVIINVVIIMEYEGALLYQNDLYFHGIRFNLIAFLSILKHGILSVSESINQGISVSQNYKYGNNGKDHISIARAPVNFPMSEWKTTSYHSFVKDGICFAIKGDNLWFDNNLSGYNDERFVKYKIDTKSIVGIGLPGKYAHTDIEDLPFGLFTMDSNFSSIKDRTISILSTIFKNGYIDEEKSAKIMNDLTEIGENSFLSSSENILKIATLDKELSSYVGKFFKSKYDVLYLSLEEFVNINNENNLQVFNSVPKDVAKECPKSQFFSTPQEMLKTLQPSTN